MSHDPNKEIQEASLIGRILSIEALLMAMGIASLVYGVINGVTISIFWGVVIVPGVFVLHKVRRKNWTKHWQELETQQKMTEERRKHSGTTSPGDR
jgi:membrane protein YdbS with pleckstrin-like domain